MSTETDGKDLAIEYSKGEVRLKIINPATDQVLAGIPLTMDLVSKLQLAIAAFWAEIGRRKENEKTK